MAKVSVNRGILIGLGAVAAGSLLALTFVLGRASRSGGLSGQPSGSQLPAGLAASPASSRRALDQPTEPPPPPTPSEMGTTESADTSPALGSAPPPENRIALQPAAGPTPAPTAVERGSAPSDAERAGVAAYFEAVDQIEPGKMSGNAEDVAGEMAAALAKGDTSGLDGMIQETEAARERLAALTPPAACAGHHQESLASLGDALEVLRSLKSAMESPDPAAGLSGVAARAAALRSRSEALQKEESALRQRYGLTR